MPLYGRIHEKRNPNTGRAYKERLSVEEGEYADFDGWVVRERMQVNVPGQMRISYMTDYTSWHIYFPRHDCFDAMETNNYTQLSGICL